jgi:hypothetical protein
VGLVAGVASTLVLAWLAAAFLDPAMPAVATILVVHALGGAMLGALVGLALAGHGRRRVRQTALAALLLAYAALAAGVAWLGDLSAVWSSRPAIASAGPAVVVVGLDGGSWRVLDPLLAAGELPTLRRFVAEGASGVLTSIEPTFSPVVWTTIATGKVAAKHGVHSFYARQNVDLRAGRFWEVVAAQGEPVGIFQWLITWPPDALPGFVVPAWLARDERTNPPELAFLKRLEMRFQQRQALTTREVGESAVRLVREGLRFATVARSGVEVAQAVRGGDSRAKYAAGKLAQLDINGDVFLAQYRKWRPRLAAAVFYGSDSLAHTHWKYHEPEAFPNVTAAEVAAHGETLREYYRRFDAVLTRIVAEAGDDATVLVVSDHGFRAAQDQLRTVSAEGLLRAIGEEERFHGQAINRQVFLLHRTPTAPAVKTDVVRAAGKLRALRHGGQPLVEVETTAEHALTVRLVDRALDVAGTVDTETGPKPLGSITTLTSWSGSHEVEGIILARGPTLRRGLHVDDASLLDVAPTVLYLLGLPVAEDMDGRVLTEMLTTETPVQTVATHDGAMPQRTAEAGGDGDVTQRLRALGYVR